MKEVAKWLLFFVVVIFNIVPFIVFIFISLWTWNGDYWSNYAMGLIDLFDESINSEN